MGLKEAVDVFLEAWDKTDQISGELNFVPSEVVRRAFEAGWNASSHAAVQAELDEHNRISAMLGVTAEHVFLSSTIVALVRVRNQQSTLTHGSRLEFVVQKEDLGELKRMLRELSDFVRVP